MPEQPTQDVNPPENPLFTPDERRAEREIRALLKRSDELIGRAALSDRFGSHRRLHRTMLAPPPPRRLRRAASR